VDEPAGVEAAAARTPGLGLLDMRTSLTPHKQLLQVSGHCAWDARENNPGSSVSGYEIHMGVSTGAALAHPAFYIGGRGEGARSQDEQIMGSYLHGMFDTPQAFAALLGWAGLDGVDAVDLNALREHSLERIADTSADLLAALQRALS
jgi:adenosylcobyric acid synthase